MLTAPPLILNPVKTAGDVKAAFIKAPVAANAGVKKGPAKKRGFTLDDDDSDYVKLMLFGPSGSGKTFPIGPLVASGKKVAIISTDFGDSGHLTVKNYLLGTQNRDQLVNVAIIPLSEYGEVADFFKAPWKYEVRPGVTLADFDPDIIMWDGFSAFQTIDISEYVGNMNGKADSKGENKDRGEFRESGLVLEMADWGAIRNATIRKGNDFLGLRKPDGRPVDKIMTCLEATISKEKETGNKAAGTVISSESFKPLLQGAGGVLLLASFDVIGRTKVKVSKKDANKGEREFTVVFSGTENTVAKNRGFDLKAEEAADWTHIWGVLKTGATEVPAEQTTVSEGEEA